MLVLYKFISFKLYFTGIDVLIAGLATHFCESSRLGELEAALIKCENRFEVKTTLNTLCKTQTSEKLSLEPFMHTINKCFAGNSVNDIFANLERDNSDWAQGVLKVNIPIHIMRFKLFTS